MKQKELLVEAKSKQTENMVKPKREMMRNDQVMGTYFKKRS
jgi:hypothetical protein